MPPTRLRSFRLVCPPERMPLVEALLQAEGYCFTSEPFSSCCRCLTVEPRPLGSSLAAFFGLIYIQDRSSMLPSLALLAQAEDDPVGAAVLDMCASPGSKTGFLAQMIGATGFVLGNEPTRPRLATLRANLQALDLLHAATCSCPGEQLPLTSEHGGLWDRIQLDPPCSGWGTVEKNPQVLKLWQGDKVKPLVALQKRLLERAATLLRPGGVVVYSTCTTNEAENEAQVRYAVAELGLEVQTLPPFPGFVWEEPLSGGEGTLRVDGERSQAQGFYMARLRKPVGAESAPPQGLQGQNAGGTEEVQGIPRFMVHETLDAHMLEAPCVDISLLPPGQIVAFSDTARFIPRQATELLPASLVWQAAPLGRVAGGRVRLAPRSRSLLPATPPPEALVLERVEDIHALLRGQSLQTGLPGRETGLYWRELPLGRVGLKNGRAVWSTK